MQNLIELQKAVDSYINLGFLNKPETPKNDDSAPEEPK